MSEKREQITLPTVTQRDVDEMEQCRQFFMKRFRETRDESFLKNADCCAAIIRYFNRNLPRAAS